MRPLVKLAVEAGPLVVFFVVNGRAGIFAGTAAFMAASVASIAAGWLMERRVPIMPLVAGFFVLTFGGLTIALDNELFIKLKPTIVNGLFAVILLGGLVLGRVLLKPLFGAAFQLPDGAWRTLTVRWGGFFIMMAVLNEIVWRNFSTEFWIGFKLFGAMPLAFVFAMAQMPLILRHQGPPEVGGADTAAAREASAAQK